MEFTFAKAPENWRAAVQDRALELFTVSQPGEHHEVSMSEPIPRYSLSCRQAREGGVEAAIPAGWRTLLFEGANPVAAVDFSDEGGLLEVDGCVGDEALDHFTEGLKAAEKLEEATPQEIRLLESPGLLFSALWLRGGERDLLLPLVREGRLRAFEAVPLAVADPVLRRKSERQVRVQGQYRNAIR